MQVTVLRKLELEGPLVPGLPAHVAAASGLVAVGNWLHVMPDDSLHMATFSLSETRKPGHSHRLLPDADLPSDEKQRKALKPDLESLAVVPYEGGHALLAVGSGSTERRRRGALQPLFAVGSLNGPPVVLDLAPLYEALPFQELNIEGVAALGDSLFLGQRGNSSEASNALVELDLRAVMEAVAEGRAWTADLLRDVRKLSLGAVNGIRLTLTDLSPFGPGHLLVAAAAEDTENCYDDGAIAGSILGRFCLATGALDTFDLEHPWKVEGVEALDDGRILMVTDGDDPDAPALLLEARDVVF